MAFVTVAEARERTGNDALVESHVAWAQAILEAYIGKDEIRINDVDDLELLKTATAWQADYIASDPMYTRFPDVNRVSLPNLDFSVSTRGHLQISGIAQLACKNLSWRRSRSITTGRADY